MNQQKTDLSVAKPVPGAVEGLLRNDKIIYKSNSEMLYFITQMHSSRITRIGEFIIPGKLTGLKVISACPGLATRDDMDKIVPGGDYAVR